MTNEQDLLTQVAITATQEIAKPLYDDAIHPVAKPTGDTLGLIPRAIKAAFLPLEKWILNREYNLAETEKLLAQKLANIPAENIIPLEPHIGVPALQQISYCIDNKELRNMYVNLLARAMNKDTKNDVHPSFAEIIKQLSPNEAILLKYFYHECERDNKFSISALSIYEVNTYGIHTLMLDRFFSILDENNYDEHNSKFYFDNLLRLQLLQITDTGIFGDSRKEDETYIDNHPEVLKITKSIQQKNTNPFASQPSYYVQKNRTIYEKTSYGVNFAKICILE